MIDTKKIELLISKIKDDFPDFEIKFKDHSWFWRRLPSAFRGSVTTIGSTIWFPTMESFETPSDVRLFKTLAHEYKHMRDQRDDGLWFFFEYALPQSLFLFLLPISIAAAVLFGPWCLVLVSLSFVSLAPWPSRARVELEIRGYSIGFLVDIVESGTVSRREIERVAQAFTGWTYYKMMWSKQAAYKRIFDAICLLENVDLVPSFEREIIWLITGIDYE